MSPEKKAVITASLTAIFLIILKTFAGLITGSMAILTSAIDSTLDFFVSLMNLFAIRKSEQPHDEDHNYGHGKIEGFGAIFEGLIIFISGLSVIYFSVEKILKNEILKKTDESIYVMVIAVVVTFFLVRYLSKIAKDTGSLVIKSDALHYKTDLYTNFGIILSLIMIKLFNLPMIDPVISILIAFYIMYGSIGVIKEGYNMLMDKSIEKEYVDFVKKIVLDHPEIDSFHFLKTRKSGKNNFVEFHIVFKDINISLKDAHDISDGIETDIICEIPNSTVTIHLDYFDDSNSKINPKNKKDVLCD
ncbi:MAG: cation diffusion facilitator family transporter [Candidatus Gracilibacteria bacterium]|nr:cation diffusion facilitator family transporter [Candidatus Gracilibacteria bacterium]